MTAYEQEWEIGVAHHQEWVGFEDAPQTTAIYGQYPFQKQSTSIGGFLLLDKIKAAQAGRIVNVASGAHKFCKTGINFDDIHFAEEFSSMKVYGHSKLANILFTQELARRLSDCDVTVNCLHPGGVASNLGKNNGALGKLLMGTLKPFFRSIDKGAETAIYLACAEDVADKSGGYYYNCKPIPPAKWALDTEAASRLWQISSDMVNSP